MSQQVALEVTAEGQPARSVPLEPGTTTIGRSVGNTIVLDNPLVSRNHLEIHSDGTTVRVSDLGSSNGSKVNGQELSPNQWQIFGEGDRLDIGPFSITLSQAPDEMGTVILDRPMQTVSVPLPLPPTPPAPVEYVAPPAPPAPVEALPPYLAYSTPVEQEAPVLPPPLVPEPAAAARDRRAQAAARPPRVAAVGGAPGQGNKTLSLMLILLAVALSIPAALSTWEQRVLLNRSQFISVGNKVLSKEAVQQELARQLTDSAGGFLDGGISSGADQILQGLAGTGGLGSVVDSVLGPGSSKAPQTGSKQSGQSIDSVLGSLLGPSTPGKTKPATGKGTSIDDFDSLLGSVLGPDTTSKVTDAGKAAGSTGSLGDSLIQPIALSIIRGLPNTDISNQALGEAYDAMISVIRSKNNTSKVTLDLDKDANDLLKKMGVPAALVDGTPNLGLVLVFDKGDLPSEVSIVSFLDGKALIFIALTALALAGAFVFAPDKPRFCVLAGGGMALGALLFIIAVKVPMRSSITSSVVKQTSGRDAVNAAYDVIAGTLVNQELIVLVAGLVLAGIGFMLTRSAATRSAASGDLG